LSKRRLARRAGRETKIPARVRSGDVALVVLIGGGLLLVWNFPLSEIFGYLYHPVSGLVALLLIIEFLWLKSGDRTRIYRLEVERLRALRRTDEELLKQCRQVLSESNASEIPGRSALLNQLNERL